MLAQFHNYQLKHGWAINLADWNQTLNLYQPQKVNSQLLKATYIRRLEIKADLMLNLHLGECHKTGMDK